MPTAFVCHSSKGREFVVREVVNPLRMVELEVWYAPESINSKQQWEREILRGLKESEFFVVVLSPRSAISEWVKDELNWAIQHRPDAIVPVMMEECEPVDFHLRLPRIQYIDFTTDISQARKQLIASPIPSVDNVERKFTNRPEVIDLCQIAVNAISRVLKRFNNESLDCIVSVSLICGGDEGEMLIGIASNRDDPSHFAQLHLKLLNLAQRCIKSCKILWVTETTADESCNIVIPIVWNYSNVIGVIFVEKCDSRAFECHLEPVGIVSNMFGMSLFALHRHQ